MGENTIVDNVKSTLVTAPLAVAHYLKQFFNQVIKTYAYNNRFKNLPGDKRLKDRVQSDWVSKTCRNIQVQVIKTAAFNNRLALKESFGMDYSKLFPGSIFNPPSYSENFVSSSSGR